MILNESMRVWVIFKDSVLVKINLIKLILYKYAYLRVAANMEMSCLYHTPSCDCHQYLCPIKLTPYQSFPKLRIPAPDSQDNFKCYIGITLKDMKTHKQKNVPFIIFFSTSNYIKDRVSLYLQFAFNHIFQFANLISNDSQIKLSTSGRKQYIITT